MDKNDIYDYLRDNLSITIEEDYNCDSETKKIVVCLKLKPPTGLDEYTIISKDYILV